MEPIYVLSLLLFLIIFLPIISRAQKRHQDWLGAWNELARCAKVVDEQGKFVSAENFYGNYRGLIVELRVTTKHIDPIWDWNISTRISVYIEARMVGIPGAKSSFAEKYVGKNPLQPFGARIINLEGRIECEPKDFSTEILLDSQLKNLLLFSNFSRLEYRENQLDLYLPGIVTDVARLRAGLTALHRLAKHITESESV